MYLLIYYFASILIVGLHGIQLNSFEREEVAKLAPNVLIKCSQQNMIDRNKTNPLK